MLASLRSLEEAEEPPPLRHVPSTLKQPSASSIPLAKVEVAPEEFTNEPVSDTAPVNVISLTVSKLLA